MVYLSDPHMFQSRKQLGVATPQWIQLTRVIYIHLNRHQNRIGLEGPQKHGEAWKVWFEAFIDGPLLDEAWEGGKAVFWELSENKNRLKSFLRDATKISASSMRNNLRKGFLPGWMNASGTGTVPGYNTSSIGGDIDEHDFAIGDSVSATGEDSNDEEPPNKITGEKNWQHKTPQEPTSRPTHARPINPKRDIPEPYQFTFRANDNAPITRKLVPQPAVAVARKRRKIEPTHRNTRDQATVAQIPQYKKHSPNIDSYSLSIPLRQQPVTFETRLQIPHTDIVRHESVSIGNIIALPAFINTLRVIHSIPSQQQIQSLEVDIDGRKIRVRASDDDGEWAWGLVMGIMHLSGITDDRKVFLDIIMLRS